ncbi:MAG: HAD family hydrolase [Faecalibacterium sp.]
MYTVLLDFNGTLFFDTRFHMQAWSEIYRELHPEDAEPLDPRLICGPRNEVILQNMAPWLSPEENRWYSQRKEELYRSVCRRNPADVHLVAGAETFLQTLRQKGVPYALASASIAANVDFYFECFPLKKYLKREDVVFDDGTYPDKGAMHLEAARRLNVPFSQCLVIEDSLTAVALAKKNGAGRIIAIGEKPQAPELLAAGAEKYIRDFSEFDCAWLDA